MYLLSAYSDYKHNEHWSIFLFFHSHIGITYFYEENFLGYDSWKLFLLLHKKSIRKN